MDETLLQMTTAIIGYGIVGKATHRAFFSQHSNLAIFDLANIAQFRPAEFSQIFICVPSDNYDNLEIILQMIKHIAVSSPKTLICVRSSVPVGFLSQDVAKIVPKIVYMPEFLRERLWDIDCFEGPIVVGSTCMPEQLMSLLNNRDVVSLSLAEAEIAKMMINSYAAMKVVFANHFYDICETTQSTYSNIQSLLSWIESRQSYLNVNENLRGFGGKCLPKDLAFLIDAFKKLGVQQSLFSSIQSDNQKWPITVRQDR